MPQLQERTREALKLIYSMTRFATITIATIVMTLALVPVGLTIIIYSFAHSFVQYSFSKYPKGGGGI